MPQSTTKNLMTNARRNMQILGTAKAESTETSRLLAWGSILWALVLAGAAFALVWFKVDLPGVLTREARLVASI